MKIARITLLVLIFLSFQKTVGHAQIIRTIAGNNLYSISSGTDGNGGPARNASFGTPVGIAVDSTGNIFVGDQMWNIIRKIRPDGIISTFAGVAYPGFGGDSGLATAASLQYPFLMNFDSAYNLYIADGANRRIRKIDTAGIITTVAGNGNFTSGYSGDSGLAINAGVGGVTGLCFDRAGNMYIADGNTRIRKVNIHDTITTIAGNGVSAFAGNGGQATAASIDAPGGVATDAAGNLYICERGPNSNISVIRKVNTMGVITTFAGNSLNQGSPTGDGGPATNARLWAPNGIKIDAAGNVYFADQSNSRIRKINTAGIITNVAGSGGGGYAGDGGPPTLAKLLSPADICFGKHGKIFISERGNQTNGAGHRIREIFYVDTFHISANPGTVLCGFATASFSAHLDDAYYYFEYHWKLNGLPVGTNSPNYSPPGFLHNNDVITCSLIDTANGGMLLAVSDTIHMIVLPPILPAITISSSGDTVCAGEPVTLTATFVNGGTSPVVRWYLFGTLMHTGPVFTYIPSVGDIIVCELTSSDPCAMPHTVQVVHPLLVKPSVSPTITISAMPGTTISYWGQLITMYSTVTYAGFAPSFQWYERNAPISGATASSYTTDIYEADTFYCVVHSNDTCNVPPIDTSNYIYISNGTLGVQNTNESLSRLSLYPNPNNGNFVLIGAVNNLPGGVIGIEIKNLLGQSVYKNSISCMNGKIEIPVGLRDDIPAGVYILITSDSNHISTTPFTVKR